QLSKNVVLNRTSPQCGQRIVATLAIHLASPLEVKIAAGQLPISIRVTVRAAGSPGCQEILTPDCQSEGGAECPRGDDGGHEAKHGGQGCVPLFRRIGGARARTGARCLGDCSSGVASASPPSSARS